MAFLDKLKGQSDNPNPWIDKATTHFEQGKYHEAVKEFEKAIEIDPENSGICYLMGRSLMYLSKYQDAERYLKRAVKKTSLPGRHLEILSMNPAITRGLFNALMQY